MVVMMYTWLIELNEIVDWVVEWRKPNWGFLIQGGFFWQFNDVGNVVRMDCDECCMYCVWMMN